jgi:hypothetical protein
MRNITGTWLTGIAVVGSLLIPGSAAMAAQAAPSVLTHDVSTEQQPRVVTPKVPGLKVVPAGVSDSAVSEANYGPVQILTNDNNSVGITYPGIGEQATITSQPGTSYVIEESTYFIIRNSNGNCLRMRDANNNYAVIEENGCRLGDHNERFLLNFTGNTVTFYNIGTGYYLGESCPAKNGNKIWGESGDSGTCVQWIL